MNNTTTEYIAARVAELTRLRGDSCALNNTTTEYIAARVAELTRLRGDDSTNQHYYALSAGIYELLALLNYLNNQVNYENQNLSHCV